MRASEPGRYAVRYKPSSAGKIASYFYFGSHKALFILTLTFLKIIHPNIANMNPTVSWSGTSVKDFVCLRLSIPSKLTRAHYKERGMRANSLDTKIWAHHWAKKQRRILRRNIELSKIRTAHHLYLANSLLRAWDTISARLNAATSCTCLA